MTPSKKIISEVTIESLNRGFNPTFALNTLKYCSMAMYKVMGAKGVVTSSEQTQLNMMASNQGGYAFGNCTVLQVTEKAFLLSLPTLQVTEKWVAKSVVKNDVVPFWAVK